jgi:hypothetical protein
MIMDLKTALPFLLPKAVQWAKEQEQNILRSGRALTLKEIQTARAVGVVQPEQIRIKLVETIPQPQDPLLAQAAVQVGLLGSDTAGLTLFYGIFICTGTFSETLLAHECRHVYQYEQRGSIDAFLQEYIQQLVTYGYYDSPLEAEARKVAADLMIALTTGKIVP